MREELAAALPLEADAPITPRPGLTAINDVRPVALSRLKIDPAVQRTKLDEPWAQWLADHWRPLKAGVLVVSVRELTGELIVLDGWHRLAAMRILEARGEPIHHAMCELLFGLSPEEEAEAFLGRNDGKTVHVIDKYKNRVRAGDGVACDIKAVLARHGACVDFAAEVGYACVATLERAYNHGVLEPAVAIIEGCWAGSEPRSARSTVVVEAVVLFLRNFGGHRHYEPARAMVKFGAGESFGRTAVTLADMVKQARSMATATGDSIYLELARILRTRYNHQARNRLGEVEPLAR